MFRSRQLFRRKPISELLVEGNSPYALKRALGAGDLIMLGIGAVIGAGIFGAIGTAAAGQYDAAGHLLATWTKAAYLPVLNSLVKSPFITPASTYACFTVPAPKNP